MPTSRPTKVLLPAAAAAALGLVLAGCAAQPASDSSEITLTLSTFGNFGYSDELLAKYEAEHPGIKIVHNVAANGTDARTNLFTKLAAGSGLADVEAIEIGWTVDLRQYADMFVPVPEDQADEWVDFQTAPVTTDDGELFAYGVATGPEAICYRSDLLEAAGLPGDPASVAQSLTGDWDDYFAAGEAYVAGGGGPWFDSAYTVYNAQIEQMGFPYEDEDDNIVADNPDVERVFRDTLAGAPQLSAGLTSFSEDWAAAMGNGGFATMACPSWMLGIIEGNSQGVTAWNVADAFPGGGGNWGGSFLAVPVQSPHPEEAAELAAWLTAPEQQIEAFTVAGPFPSRLAAFDLPELKEITNPFFNDAPVGEIFTERSTAIDMIVYKGPKYFQIDQAAKDAIARVEAGTQSIDDAWAQFVSDAEDLK
ncbi:ABC transporter substrate-binding protein [Microbacterium sp. DT81.1]|uniref:ABC transporter substrate-binding protein n=1 Tax=Microbacterium sp. DT81.1 TaxID=3393413 RepID=UPI003CF4FE1A